MTHSGNGRTIKIPIRKVERQLPTLNEEPRPLLTGPDNCREAVVQAQTELKAELELWQARASHWQVEAADWRAQATRWQDEAEAIRRRSERRTEFRIREEQRRLTSRMLAVADSLERALAHADKADALYTGVRLTLDDLLAQLAQEGVEPIHALGQPFDPKLHEAVATDGSTGDKVVEVIRTGYTLDGELLRPAQVVVGNWAP